MLLDPNRIPHYTFRMRREWGHLYETVNKTNGNIAEIGCNRGNNTLLFGTNFPDRTVYALDFVDGVNTMPIEQDEKQDGDGTFMTPAAIAIKAKHLPNVKIMNQNSQIFNYDLFDNVTMFFVDADHSYKGVRADTYKAINYLRNRNGGYIACHDYRNDDKYPWIGVKKFIDTEIVENYKVTFPWKTFLAVIEVQPVRR